MTAPTSTDKSSVKIQVRDAIKGVWSPVSGIGGLTLRQIFQNQAGKEVVCEYRRGEKVWYICGTERWRLSMKKKGTAITFDEVITLLDSVNPGWLKEVPVTVEMEDIMARLGQPEPCLSGFDEM